MSSPPRVSPVPGSGLVAGAGGLAALVFAVLVVTAPRGVLLVVLIPVQLSLAAGWLTLAAVPLRGPGIAAVAGAGILTDVLVIVRSQPGAGAPAGVIGVGVVAAVVAQLIRRDRAQVTEVIAAQCSALLLAVAPSVLLVVAGGHRADRLLAAALVAVGLVALGRLGAGVAPGSRWTPARSVRVPLGLVVAGSAGSLLGFLIGGGPGAVAGAAAGILTVYAGEVAAVLAPARSSAALAGVLPFAVVAPAVYVIGRAMIR